jgi:hypothetical protein
MKKAESAPAPKAKKSEEAKEPKERLQRPPDETARQGARYKAV